MRSMNLYTVGQGSTASPLYDLLPGATMVAGNVGGESPRREMGVTGMNPRLHEASSDKAHADLIRTISGAGSANSHRARSNSCRDPLKSHHTVSGRRNPGRAVPPNAVNSPPCNAQR